MVDCRVSRQLERYAYWTNLLLSCRRPVLIMGEVGVGKTSLIEVRLESPFWESFSTLMLLFGWHSLYEKPVLVYPIISLPRAEREICNQVYLENLASSPWSECAGCCQQGHAGSKTLHLQNPPVLNWRCQLMQVYLYNGRKMVVVVCLENGC